MKRPRKRRTQTLAEKGVATELHPWTAMMGTYLFRPDKSVSITLAERSGTWTMSAVIKGQRYSGERPTLEEAFKATANLLFKHAKDFWLRMDPRVVTEPWSHFLPEIK